MPALGDVIRIIVQQSLLGEQVRNVYHYETTLASGTDTPQDIWDAFRLAVIVPVSLAQHVGLSYDLAVIEDLNDELFFEEIPLAFAGLLTGLAMPSFVAFGVKLLRTFKTTRNGSKRFAGVREENVDDNQQNLTPAVSGPIEVGLATLLDLTVLPALSGAYTPVIFRPGSLGPPIVVEFSNPVKSAQVAANITTQNSRKAGTGI